MKKFIPLLILLFLTSLNVSAQSRGKNKKKQRPAKTEMKDSPSEKKSSRSESVKPNRPMNPREDRSIGITIESGFKSLAGFGLNGTYYANPKIAIDLGLGIGLQLFKGGIRGRYLFLDKKFTPYVGAGVFFNPLALDDFEISTPDETNFIDIQSSTFGQFCVGAEFMGDNGFLIGFNVGYAYSFNDTNWSSDFPVSTEFEQAIDIIYDSSLSFGFNLGWAF